jgi:hypothetical protein
MNVSNRQSSSLKTESESAYWHRRVMLYAREPLLFGGSDESTVLQKATSRIMKVPGEPDDVQCHSESLTSFLSAMVAMADSFVKTEVRAIDWNHFRVTGLWF